MESFDLFKVSLQEEIQPYNHSPGESDNASAAVKVLNYGIKFRLRNFLNKLKNVHREVNFKAEKNLVFTFF